MGINVLLEFRKVFQPQKITFKKIKTYNNHQGMFQIGAQSVLPNYMRQFRDF